MLSLVYIVLGPKYFAMEGPPHQFILRTALLPLLNQD